MRPGIKIRIHLNGHETGLSRSRITRICRSILRGEAWDRTGEVHVILTDEPQIRKMNSKFLGHHRTTDVMAFPLCDPMDQVLGEIYICAPRAMAQAAEYGVTPAHETARLVIHGMLHLAGYTDGTKRDREAMHEKENDYLVRLGIN